MKKWKISWFVKSIIVITVFFFFTGITTVFFKGKGVVPKTGQGSILALDLKGMIIDKPKFLKDLRQHSQDEKIKGVLIRLDSPGGSVALSQEIYHEFKKIQGDLKKPVVVSAGSMMTSGALYAAAGASFVFVNSGTLAGSIGVIVPLMNMERLYDWAKVEPYSIKTGEFKDTGTRFRPMTSRERVLFQDLINELLEQFKSAIMEGRNMAMEDLEPYTDARVFTGEVAVSAGFADSIGTYSDAIEKIGELSGLGKKPKLFTPQPTYFDLLSGRVNSRVLNAFIDRGAGVSTSLLEEKKIFFSLLGFHSGVRPLYIFPPAIGM